MHLSKALFVIMASVAVFVACSKDDDKPYNLGNTTWVDSANIGGNAYKPFTVVFNQDGTATFKFNTLGPYAGTWNKPVTADSVYFYFDESATTKWKGTGILTNKNTKIENGILTRLTPTTASGTFRLTRQ